MTTQYDLKVPPQKAENIKDEKIISPPPSLSPSKQKTLSWQWFHNLPIQRKQLISLLATEVISVVGLVGVGTGLMIAGGRAQLLSQAKSELAVSELYYQMGADSRQQIENAAIIEAARNYAQGQPLSLALKDQLRQILRNETASKQIEYATLVGKDLRIIANANADRTGEKFDPDGIVASVFKNSQQLKVSAIVNWNELQKEAPPLPKGFANSDALIRYTVTPVRDPQTREVIGALVFGDIVNSKLPIVENSLQTLEKGYSALYLSAPSGKYILATSVGKNTNNESPQVNQPLTDITLLKSAVAAKGQTVTQRVQAGEHTYGMAAKALSDVNGKPIAVLVRGTPEASLNEILKSNLLLQWSIAAIAIIAQTALAIALGRTITQPVNQLRKSTQNFLKGDRQARAEICGPDELGELGSTFNQLADRIVGFENKLSQQARRLTTVAERSRLLNNIIANVRRSLKEEEILNTAVSELRHLLNTDRVIVYRFHDDWNGTIIAESVVAGCRQILGQVVNDPFREGLIDLYRNGRVRAMNDIYAEGLTNCHRDILENFQIRASIVAPILYQGKLTGLLCAHHCSAPRHWEKEDIDLVAQLSIQLGFALDQASLLQHQKMTAKYAEQLNAITYRMRCSFTREQVFQECVLGTRAALDVDRTIVYLFDENLSGTVVAESVVQGWPAALGATIADPCFANGYVEKYQQGRIQATYNIYTAGLTECHLNQLAAFEVKANLVAPILSEGKLLGLLICHQCSGPRDWQDTEINLMRQIAMQLDFALEQANLLEQREQARLQAEALFEEQLQQREAIHQQLIHLIGNIEGVYRGDLTVRAEVTAGEIGTVADFFNSIVESLGQIVTKVKQSAVQVNSSLGENEGAIRHLAEVALKQAAETTRTLNSIEQMTQSIQVVAQSARQAAEVARSASLTAEEGEMAMDLTVENILSLRETVAQTAKKVKRLGEASQQISKVVSLINQIAMQTNLLAINAGIEAARAGEEGQGFAVVAEEVGALAARSAGATQEIERIVEDIQRETAQVVEAMEQSTTQVVKGTSLVKDTKQSLGQILDVSRQIDQLVQSISSATVSQVQTAQAVSSLMKEIAQVSEGTADSSRSVSHSLRQTVEIAQELQKSVGTFKVS